MRMRPVGSQGAHRATGLPPPPRAGSSGEHVVVVEMRVPVVDAVCADVECAWVARRDAADLVLLLLLLRLLSRRWDGSGAALRRADPRQEKKKGGFSSSR